MILLKKPNSVICIAGIIDYLVEYATVVAQFFAIAITPFRKFILFVTLPMPVS